MIYEVKYLYILENLRNLEKKKSSLKNLEIRFKITDYTTKIKMRDPKFSKTISNYMCEIWNTLGITFEDNYRLELRWMKEIVQVDSNPGVFQEHMIIPRELPEERAVWAMKIKVLCLWSCGKKAFNDAHQRLCPSRASGHECGCLPVSARLVYIYLHLLPYFSRWNHVPR